MPSGVLRLDVRATIKTDDDQLIYIIDNGILQHSKECAEKLNNGELLTTKHIPYFITAPTFQTSSEKYAWLNSVQAINNVVEVKLGERSYVPSGSDMFIVGMAEFYYDGKICQIKIIQSRVICFSN